MLLGVGLNKIRDLHVANIDKAWMGTDSSALSETQTGLQEGVTATKTTVTINTSDKTAIVNFSLPSTAGTATVYREYSFMKDGVVEYSRVIFTGILHTSNEDIVVRGSMFYRNA